MSRTAPARKMPHFLMRIYSLVFGALRSDRMLFRALFGFTPLPDIKGPLWDWTTMVLRRALRRTSRSGARLLDMGTGPAAVLGIYARNTLQYAHVCAVDHIPEIVSSARRSAAFAPADIEVRESSLFQSVDGRYEVIAFNAPYIDAASGTRLGLLDSDTAKQRWCGGEDGMETIDRFLDTAGDCLAPGGLVLLGVNHFYVPPRAIEHRVERHQWFIAWTIRNRWTHAAVYALRRAEALDRMHTPAANGDREENETPDAPFSGAPLNGVKPETP